MKYLLAICIVLSICTISNSSLIDVVRHRQPVKVEKDGTEPKVIQFQVIEVGDRVRWVVLYDDGQFWSWNTVDKEWTNIGLPR